MDIVSEVIEDESAETKRSKDVVYVNIKSLKRAFEKNKISYIKALRTLDNKVGMIKCTQEGAKRCRTVNVWLNGKNTRCVGFIVKNEEI